MNNNLMLMCDFYKICHRNMYPKNTNKLYCTWTPRSNKFFKESDKVVWFGLQGFMMTYLMNYFDNYFFKRPIDEIIEEYKYYIGNTFDKNVDTSSIEELHKLGYLPIEIKALPEGTLVPYGIPCCTVTNTDENFAWVVNFLETLFSCEMWLPSTTATRAYLYRKIIEKYVSMTSEKDFWKSVGVGDFSFRGMAGLDAAIISGSAFLTSFTKTSTIPSIRYICENYLSDVSKQDIGSWSASVEHSCTTSNFAVDGDEETFFVKMCTELYPNSSFSYVSDSYDYWNFIDNIVRKNKNIILNHNGRINIRPDSGEPENIICGTVPMWKEYENKEQFENYYKNSKMMRTLYCGNLPENRNEDNSLFNIYVVFKDGLRVVVTWDNVDGKDVFNYRNATIEEIGSLNILWEIFGGTINSKGYKVLDPHIGMVYGDAITLQRCENICAHMERMGFAVENVIFGAGSYSFQYNTRDTQGWAYKCTYAEVDKKPILVYKNPKTGDGTKTSQKGMVRVYEDKDGEIKCIDNIVPNAIVTSDLKYSDFDMMRTVFKDGVIFNVEDFTTIRNRIYNNNF